MTAKNEKITFKPIVGFDEQNTNNIVFYYKDKNKRERHVVENVDWYFCVKTVELSKELRLFLNKVVRQKKIHIKTEQAGDYTKIYCERNTSYLFRKIFEKFNTKIFEADFSRTKRYMIDNAIEIEEDLSILFFDIETDDSKKGIVIGRDRILSWAACDEKTGETFYYSSDDEKEVIQTILDLFEKYDLIVGWNSKQFDLPYIIKRIEINNVVDEDGILLDEDHEYWKRLMHVDMMKRFVKLFSMSMSTVGLTKFSLEEVSQVFLNEGKIKHEEQIIKLFKTNKEKLKEYNINDVLLLYKLNQKLKTLPLMIKECVWTNTFINKFYISELLDNYILQETKKQNIFLNTKPDWKEDLVPEKIRGGYVMKPKIGLYENIRVLDYKSLYPSIIVGWNIGHESLIENISNESEKNFNEWLGDRKLEKISFVEWNDFLKEQNIKLNPNNKYIQTGNNLFFSRDKQSIIAKLIQKLLDERKKYKKIQFESEYGSLEYENAYASQYTIKELTNSIYGITADNRTRFFNKRIAEAITTTGQFLSRTSIHIFENKMNQRIIYADTDSVFTKIDDDNKTKETVKKINEHLSTYLTNRFSILHNIVALSYEKKFRKFLMIDKKRYSGHLIEIDGAVTDNILSKGTENVRKNITEYSRHSIEELLNLILKENKNSDYFFEWIRERRREIYEEDLHPDVISISMRLSKSIKDYKTKLPHIRLAEQLIKNEEILDVTERSNVWGPKIDFIIDNSRKVDTDAIGATNLEEFDGDWDREYYWDIQVLPPILKILKTAWADKKWEEMFSSIYKKKLEKQTKRELHKKEREIELETTKLVNKISKELKLK